MTEWIAAIPWIIAAIGWVATHFLSESRERRKEVSSQLDKVLDRLSKLEESAREFHTSAQYDAKKATSIVFEIDRIERFLHRLAVINVDDLVPVIIHHRRAITFKNFDKSSFSPVDFNSRMITDISFATQEFEDDIEGQYRVSYPPKFPYFKRPWA